MSSLMRIQFGIGFVNGCASFLGIGFTIWIMSQIARFVDADYSVGLVTVIGVFLMTAIPQVFLNRIWLAPLLKLVDGKHDQLVEEDLKTIISLPIRISLASAGFWFIALAVAVVALRAQAETPTIRLVQISTVISGMVLAAFVFQYFGIKAVIDRAIGASKIPEDVLSRRLMTFRPLPLRRKYVMMFIPLVLSAMCVAGVLSFSMGRNAMLIGLYSELVDAMQSALEAKHRGEDTEIEWRNIERGYRLRVVEMDRPGEALPVEALFERPHKMYYFLPAYQYETQALPDVLRVYSKMANGRFLVLEKDLAAFNGLVTTVLVRITFVYILIALMGWLLLYLFARDIARPVQMLLDYRRLSAENPLRVPPVFYSEDEAGRMTAGFRIMLLRVTERLESLKGLYWSLRDAQQGLTSDLKKYNIRSRREDKLLDHFFEGLERIRNDLQDLHSSLTALDKAGEESLRTIAAINETIRTMESAGYNVRETATRFALLQKQVAGQEGATAKGRFGGDISDFIRMQSGFLEVSGSMCTQTEGHSFQVANVFQQLDKCHEHATESGVFFRIQRDDAEAIVLRIREVSEQFSMMMERLRGLQTMKQDTDILGFQATLVASQSPNYHREFLVVADEMKDLAERTDAAISSVVRALAEIHEQSQTTFNRLADASDVLGAGIELTEYADRQFGRLSREAKRASQDADAAAKVAVTSAKVAEEMLEAMRQVASSEAVLHESMKRDPIGTGGIELETLVQQNQEAVEKQQLDSRNVMDVISGVSKTIHKLHQRGERISQLSNQVEDVLVRLREEAERTNENTEFIGECARAVADAISSADEPVKRLSRYV